jgi:hypothetical protein
MTGSSRRIGKLKILIFLLAAFCALFPPHFAERLYVSTIENDPTTGIGTVFGGFHFWGYQSERMPYDDVIDSTGWSSHHYNHRVAWSPLLLLEAVALAALYNHFWGRKWQPPANKSGT